MMVALEKGAKGGCPHPKLRVAQELLRKHFAEHAAAAAAEAAAAAGGGGGGGGAGPSSAAGGGGTRAMVFTSYRESVNELVPLLAQIEGVRPTKFIGQASSGVGENGRGLKQKEQRAVVREFEKGTHNVLVATSIGEEGLDIGEVDLIVCFDAPTSGDGLPLPPPPPHPPLTTHLSPPLLLSDALDPALRTDGAEARGARGGAGDRRRRAEGVREGECPDTASTHTSTTATATTSTIAATTTSSTTTPGHRQQESDEASLPQPKGPRLLRPTAPPAPARQARALRRA